MCNNQTQVLRKIISFLENLSQGDIYIKIILTIARSEHGCLSLRGLSREISMSPKNVKKYVIKLEKLGLIRVEQPHEKLLLIYLYPSLEWLRYLTRLE